jgi:flavorubredoxin
MNAIVVYESVWGNTAAVARAIAEGLGGQAFATDEVPADQLESAELIVAGAPVFGFSLPTEAMRSKITPEAGEAAPNLAHPSLRSWLDALPRGKGKSAAFETRIWWSPRGATSTIAKKLKDRGYPPVAKGAKFVVKDKTGPLREGELERARAWGAELKAALAA